MGDGSMTARMFDGRTPGRAALSLAFALTVAGCGSVKDSSAMAQSDLTAKATFAYHVGDAFIQSLGFPAGNKAAADNGDVVTIIGTGTFDVVAKAATGGGTFVHKTSGGAVVASGTWAATGLLDFQSYGNAVPQGLPPTFFGGRAGLTALLTPSANPSVHLPAILQVECELGNPPAGTAEGVRLNVQD